MSRLFSPENPFMQFLSKVCDMLILNVVFIFSCVPLFTIGASLSALNTIALKLVRREEPYIVKGFFKAFAANFKQSTIVWLLSVAVFLCCRLCCCRSNVPVLIEMVCVTLQAGYIEGKS